MAYYHGVARSPEIERCTLFQIGKIKITNNLSCSFTAQQTSCVAMVKLEAVASNYHGEVTYQWTYEASNAQIVEINGTTNKEYELAITNNADHYLKVSCICNDENGIPTPVYIESVLVEHNAEVTL